MISKVIIEKKWDHQISVLFIKKIDKNNSRIVIKAKKDNL